VIALVTDSNAQLPDELRDRYRVRVVPLTIVVDGEDRLEGVDLDPDEFYDRLSGGAQVSTAAPSPGRFAEAYTEAASAGASEILSIHIGSNTSATVSAAQLAVGMSPVPVEIVDTGTASFPIACCVWAAALAIERGADVRAAADAARAVAETIGNVFIVGALDLARRGGRLAADVADEGVPVLALAGGTMEVVGQARDVEDAVDAMAASFEQFAGGRPMRVGVGHARAEAIADELEARLRARPEVVDLVRYFVGPSVGAHSGPGTVGAVFFPEELARDARA
jgi:DegV family protein with EDD domain